MSFSLNAIKAAASPYLLWIKVIGAVILIAFAIYQIHAYNERRRAEGAADIQASYGKGYAAALANAQAKEAADRSMWQARSQSYEDQLNALRNAKSISAPRVLCHQPAASHTVSGAATSPGEPGETNPDKLGTADARPAERDIGPALMAYAERVQEMAIQCAEIQRGYLELTAH